MTRKWCVLVVGCGWVSRQVHLPYLAQLHQTGRLAALHVADTDAGRAAAAARDFGARPCHGPLGKTRADVVLIATPPASHARLAIGALANGAHVIVEKPLALTAADAASVLAASACHSRGVYPLYTSRHRADAALIRRAAGPQLGEVLAVRASWLRRDGVPTTAGGTEAGVLWDLAAHLADAAVYLAGWTVVCGSVRARHLHPTAGNQHPGQARARWQRCATAVAPLPAWNGAAADALLTCWHPHGTARRELSVRASWSAPVASDQTRVELTGERGVLVWRTVLGWSPDRQAVPEPAVWITRPGGAQGPVLLARQPRDPRAEYAAQLDMAFAALAQYHTDPAGCDDALEPAYASTAVLDAAQASLSTGAPHRFEVSPIPAVRSDAR